VVAGFVESLAGSYRGISSPARAPAAVFAAELVFGHFAFMAYRARGWLAAASCSVVVLLCAFVDIGIAPMQGTVVKRQVRDATTYSAPAPPSWWSEVRAADGAEGVRHHTPADLAGR
jgi:hypothetical protein